MEDKERSLKSQVVTQKGHIESFNGSPLLYLPDITGLCVFDLFLIPVCEPIPNIVNNRNFVLYTADKFLIVRDSILTSRLTVFRLIEGKHPSFDFESTVFAHLRETFLDIVICDNRVFVSVYDGKTESSWIGILDRSCKILKKINLAVLGKQWIGLFAVEKSEDEASDFILYIPLNATSAIQRMKMKVDHEDVPATLERRIIIPRPDIAHLVYHNKLLHVFDISGVASSYTTTGVLQADWRWKEIGHGGWGCPIFVDGRCYVLEEGKLSVFR